MVNKFRVLCIFGKGVLKTIIQIFSLFQFTCNSENLNTEGSKSSSSRLGSDMRASFAILLMWPHFWLSYIAM